MKPFLKTITTIATVFMTTVSYGQVLSSGFFGNHEQVLKTGAEQYAKAAGAKAFVRMSQGLSSSYSYEYKKDGSNYNIFIGVPSVLLDISYEGGTMNFVETTGKSYTVEGVQLEVYNNNTGYKKRINLTVNNAWGKGKQYKAVAFTEADVQNVISKVSNLTKTAAISTFQVRIISNGTLTASSFPTAEVKKKIQESKDREATKKEKQKQTIVLDKKTTPATSTTNKSLPNHFGTINIKDLKEGEVYYIENIIREQGFYWVRLLKVEKIKEYTPLENECGFDRLQIEGPSLLGPNEIKEYYPSRRNALTIYCEASYKFRVATQGEKDWLNACIEKFGDEREYSGEALKLKKK